MKTCATLSLTTMLAELRKYGIGLVLAHQYLGQLDRRVQDAVLGNTGTTITFRVGGQDAKTLVSEFELTFTATDLVKLPNYMIYLKLMIDGEVSKPFSAETIFPL